MDTSAEVGDLPEDVQWVRGDARDPDVATRAATTAEDAGPLRGWVDNAAVFRDAGLLPPAAGFVNGAVLPVDGGRAVLGVDPEAPGTS